MQFQPKSEKDIQAQQLAPEGDYDFEVLRADDATSKKGNVMIALKIGLYSGEAIHWHVFDYLLGAMEAKLRHFADTTGLLAKYESGELAARDCVGRAGRCRIVIAQDKNQVFSDKNAVKDYIVRTAKPLPGKPLPGNEAKAEAEIPDDIPF